MPVIRRLPLVVLALAVLAALPSIAAASTPKTPKTVWLCKPGLARDPCDPGLATTSFSPTGAVLGVEPNAISGKQPIDCFYVYPTVSGQPTPQATLRIDPEERSIALFQAARFSQHCRVFAPMYRQRTLSGLFAGRGLPPQRRSNGYADVRDAWKTYLARYNHGRGVVLIGHSQGSFVLSALIADQIDRRPAVRRRLVSAILLGGNVLVRTGRDVGGDFQHVRACRTATQTGCVVAYSTFEDAPPANTLFGRTSVPGMQVLCTNPAALGGGSGTLDPIFPSQPFAPGTLLSVGIKLLGYPMPKNVGTPWIAVPGSYTASCSSEAGANVLRIAPRDGAPALRASPDPTWGLHLVDGNIALGNLVGLVRSQARAWARADRPRASRYTTRRVTTHGYRLTRP
jgi:hypothetical protein